MCNNPTQDALHHYGSWERLLDRIDGKVDYYSRIEPIYKLWEDSGLRPAHILDRAHPAYFSDAIALRCLRTYQPDETDHSALERCMVSQLHETFTLMDKADRSQVQAHGNSWEQYILDSLLRLAWRLQGQEVTIPFYLTRRGDAELADAFRLEVCPNSITLVNCDNQHFYDLPVNAQMTQDYFSLQMHRFFQLATEAQGCFVPTYVWLSPEALVR